MGLEACSPEPDCDPMDAPASVDRVRGGAESANPRSRIVVVGAHGVGKRALVRRLIHFETDCGNAAWDHESNCHEWTIDTKYYSVDVDVAVARTDDGHVNKDGEAVLPWNCEALVMVFDLSKPATFASIQSWASTIDLRRFEILLCIGNKADQVHANDNETRGDDRSGSQSGTLNPPGPSTTSSSNEAAPPVEARLSAGSASSAMPLHSSSSMGISTATISSETPAEYGAPVYLDWCSSNCIEYVEACAVDEVFDKAIQIDGFGQGVGRIRNALSAHMWPGMRMKPLPGREEMEMAAAALSGLTTNDQQPQGERTWSDDDEHDDDWKYHPHELLSSARVPESWIQQEVHDDLASLDHGPSGTPAAPALAPSSTPCPSSVPVPSFAPAPSSAPGPSSGPGASIGPAPSFVPVPSFAPGPSSVPAPSFLPTSPMQGGGDSSAKRSSQVLSSGGANAHLPPSPSSLTMGAKDADRVGANLAYEGQSSSVYEEGISGQMEWETFSGEDSPQTTKKTSSEHLEISDLHQRASSESLAANTSHPELSLTYPRSPPSPPPPPPAAAAAAAAPADTPIAVASLPPPPSPPPCAPANTSTAAATPPPPPPPAAAASAAVAAREGGELRNESSRDAAPDVANGRGRREGRGRTRNGERNGVSDEHEGDGSSIDGFEQLLADMAMVRERGQGMPDRQRRELAATMAIRMVRMLASDDDDDGGGDDDDDDDVF